MRPPAVLGGVGAAAAAAACHSLARAGPTPKPASQRRPDGSFELSGPQRGQMGCCGQVGSLPGAAASRATCCAPPPVPPGFEPACTRRAGSHLPCQRAAHVPPLLGVCSCRRHTAAEAEQGDGWRGGHHPGKAGEPGALLQCQGVQQRATTCTGRRSWQAGRVSLQRWLLCAGEAGVGAAAAWAQRSHLSGAHALQVWGGPCTPVALPQRRR